MLSIHIAYINHHVTILHLWLEAAACSTLEHKISVSKVHKVRNTSAARGVLGNNGAQEPSKRALLNQLTSLNW